MGKLLQPFRTYVLFLLIREVVGNGIGKGFANRPGIVRSYLLFGLLPRSGFGRVPPTGSALIDPFSASAFAPELVRPVRALSRVLGIDVGIHGAAC